jgi:hypothetical protein
LQRIALRGELELRSLKIQTPRKRGRAGLKRISDLLDQLREFSELDEPRPTEFELESRPFLHFHHLAEGTIIADVRLSKRRFIAFDVSEEVGQHEVLDAVERHLESRRGGQQAR